MLSIRKIGAFGRTYRHLNRYRQILAILIKHGFGDLIERLNIDQYIEIGLQMLSSRRNGHSTRLTSAERIRMALEELGPTYIKLGQILSTRSDLVPGHLAQELVKLQDDVPPFPFSGVRQIFDRELGRSPDEVFDDFEEKPLASASIGQVHRARLKTGEIVAIKVQRPDIEGIVEADLEIMLHLATLIEGNIEEAALHRPVRVVEEFARIIEEELDYANEAANMERFARQFAEDVTVYVPRVFREISTERILVMEFVSGVKVSDVEKLEQARLNKKKVVQRGADLMLRQVFDYGFFHADPHPGNICVLPGNVICLMDFGMMGRVDRQMRGNFVDLIYYVVRQDEAGAARGLLRLTHWEDRPNIRTLERDVARLMDQYLFRPLGDIEIGRLLQQMMELTARHHLRLPPDIFLMMKAFSTIEGVARQLDPEFDLTAQAAPFIRREKMERIQPRRIIETLFALSSEMGHFLNRFPKEALEVVRMVRKQRLLVRFEHQGLDGLRETIDRTSNKLSFAIIIAALIIGSSIVIIAKIPPLFYGISLIGIIVFVAAAVMGIWLIVAMLRSGRF